MREKESRVLSLRNFNYWVKSGLTSEHCRPGFTVLDLCCGEGAISTNGDRNRTKAKCNFLFIYINRYES